MKLEGLDELKRNLDRYGANFDRELSGLVAATAQSIRTRAIKKIQRGPKTGTVYYRIPGPGYMTIRAGSIDGPPVAFIPGGGAHNLSPVHRASAPGEPPATDSGRLAGQSIEAEISGLSAGVGTNLKYGLYLELGTTKIKPRPWLFPSMEEERPKWEAGLEKIHNKAVPK